MLKWIKKITTVRPQPKKIAWWWGQDAVRLVHMPPVGLLFRLRILNTRLFWKIAHHRFNEHWVNHIELLDALLEFGIPWQKIKVVPNSYEKIKVKKVKHEFTVLFYINMRGEYGRRKKYVDWIYGKKYYDYLMKHYNVYLITGSNDIRKVLTKVDCYVKVNNTQYSGMNQIGKQCLDNDIPVYVIQDWRYSFEENIERLDKWINMRRKQIALYMSC